MSYQSLLQEEQERREDVERQLFYKVLSLEEMHRKMLDLRSAYDQQSIMLQHYKQQCALLTEQVKTQHTILVEKERLDDERNRASKQQLLIRASDEVRRFHAANESAPSDVYLASDSPLSRVMSIVPSEIPAPKKYPHVDWSMHYSIARLEDMMEVPESSRNSLFHALLSFHLKRLKEMNVDEELDNWIERIKEESHRNQL